MMISKLKTLFKRQESVSEAESAVIFTEISEEQQEAMKGGYPWPGFPPVGGGGGGFSGGTSSQGGSNANANAAANGNGIKVGLQ